MTAAQEREKAEGDGTPLRRSLFRQLWCSGRVKIG